MVELIQYLHYGTITVTSIVYNYQLRTITNYGKNLKSKTTTITSNKNGTNYVWMNAEVTLVNIR